MRKKEAIGGDQTPAPEEALVTSHGKKMLRELKAGSKGMGEWANRMNSLGDYTGFMANVDQLKDDGFIEIDEDERVSLTHKGKKIISKS